MTIGSDQALECALELSELTGKFAAGCIEHGRPSESVLSRSAKYARNLGVELLCSADFDPIEAVRGRFDHLGSATAFESKELFAKAAGEPVSWGDLQRAQLALDAVRSPELAELDGPARFARHLMELASVAGEAAANLCYFSEPPSGPLAEQLAEMVIVGVRIGTAAGEKLSTSDAVPLTLEEALEAELQEFEDGM